MRLVACVEQLASWYGYDAIIIDNAYTYDLANLLDAVSEDTDEDTDDGYVVFDDAIYRLDADGYMESTPCYRLTKEK